jgi:hypothetical protein
VGSGTKQYRQFGYSVAASGGTVVVGSADPYVGDPGSERAYVFMASGGTWRQVAELAGHGAASSSCFGTSLAVSGNTVVVGAPGFDFTTQAGHFDKYPGRAYVFARGARGWYQEAELAGSDAGPSALFGYSVAVSGHTIVVGAPGAPSVPTEGPGRAYVFERVASGWRQVAELKGAAAPTAFAFGASVGVSGGTAVVGTQYLTHGSYRAYMFQEGASGWQRTAVLADTRTAGLGDDDTFAGSVAVSDGTVVVGGAAGR